ncbi:MAG: hypothetical protein IJ383_02235 [Bacteroidales bacterium]|nr:hypothetical protein [Bacteroidales bacterium]
MTKKRAQKGLKSIFLMLLVAVLPVFAAAQSGEDTVDELVRMGFENVGWAEDEEERVYVLENTAYRIDGIGIGKAIDLIQKYGLPQDKVCRLIVLNNNVPMISLCCNAGGDKEITRHDWNVSYDLGDSWELVKGEKRQNSSLYKVDFLVYPSFSFKNVRLSVMYEFQINASPAMEVSLWRGSKLSAQLVIPILNQYGYLYDEVRPGMITLSQTVRLPYNTFLTGTVGIFSNERWGADMKVEHFFKNERFSVDARVSYTGWGRWGEWERGKSINAFRFGYDKHNMIFTGSIGGSYYIPKYNLQFSLHGEKYLLEELGIRFDMIRHFRYCSIGFYGMKVEDAGNDGYNAGFRFQVTLPPYKYKRRGYVPRVQLSRNVGLSYNAGNEFIYGKGFKAQASDNISEENRFNPYYIKSELLKF